VLGRWSFLSELREGETPQTQPPVETKEKEYKRRLTRRGNSNVLAHFSSIRVLTVLIDNGVRSFTTRILEKRRVGVIFCVTSWLPSRRIINILIAPRRDDAIRFLHSRLAGDTTPDAMDGSLEENS